MGIFPSDDSCKSDPDQPILLQVMLVRWIQIQGEQNQCTVRIGEEWRGSSVYVISWWRSRRASSRKHVGLILDRPMSVYCLDNAHLTWRKVKKTAVVFIKNALFSSWPTIGLHWQKYTLREGTMLDNNWMVFVETCELYYSNILNKLFNILDILFKHFSDKISN